MKRIKQGPRVFTGTKKSFFALCAIATLSPACDKFENQFPDNADFNAGGADPYNFPPAYRGVGATRQTAASGTFTEIAAYANGTATGYFTFPFSPSQVTTTNYAAPIAMLWPDGQIDPLRVAGPGTDFRASLNNPVPVPSVYNFDPPGNGSSNPFATAQKCHSPAGYVYNSFLEAFPQTEQWNVFTFLPDRYTTYGFGTLPAWSYRPIVAEVPVTTGNYTCQTAKSERTVLEQNDQGTLGVPLGPPEADKTLGSLGKANGKFLAWAIIDPGSAVLRVGTKSDGLSGGTHFGTTVQKYGWYGQFIVAYIDGGYIPTEAGPTVAGAPTTRMRTQRLYYPRSFVYTDGKDPSTASAGTFGAGYDVMQGSRFASDPSSYSPVCELWTYSLPTTTAISQLPKDENTILALANSTLEPARTSQSTTAYTPSTTIVPKYVFCLEAATRLAAGQ